jgi:Pyruvate/2-oxoacid:ferredoxin oxidoreductase delta subunit
VTVAYRRGREDMPAFADEIEEALEEGVALEPWAIPLEVTVRDGCARWLKLQKARPGRPDASGRPRPEPVEGAHVVLPADLVVVAAGEVLDGRGVPEAALRDGGIGAEGFATAVPRLFAAGDALGGGGTVAHALGDGRRAAGAILAALGLGPAPAEPVASRGASAEVVGADRIRAHAFARAEPNARGRADVRERLRGGHACEVRLGFSPGEARAEAARCLSCGTCTGCDVCFRLCPDLAVVRGAPGGYGFDAFRCKGCGICAEECPRGAVGLAPIGGT